MSPLSHTSCRHPILRQPCTKSKNKISIYFIFWLDRLRIWWMPTHSEVNECSVAAFSDWIISKLEWGPTPLHGFRCRPASLVQWWHHKWHDDYTTQTIQPTAPSWRRRYNLQLQVEDDYTTYSCELKMTYSSELKMTIQRTALSWRWLSTIQLWVEKVNKRPKSLLLKRREIPPPTKKKQKNKTKKSQIKNI